jgi:ribosome-associated toxin RatA of RatAB toxin-antitoxin module
MDQRLRHFLLIVFVATGVDYAICAFGPRSMHPCRVSAQADKKQGFTQEERKRLANGQLVVRSTTKRRGQWKLIGGSSWQVINSPPRIVWKALLDTQYYHRMLPRIIGVRPVVSNPNRLLLYVEQGTKFFQVSYYLNLNIDSNRQDITFNIDENRPHTLRAGWGFYTVRPYGRDKTVLAYGVMADIGDSIFLSLVQDSVHEWMLKVPEMIKKFVEGSGRYIYK